MQLTWRNGLTSDEVNEIHQLLGESEETDGVPPVGEHVLRRLRSHTTVVQQIEPVQADVGGSEHFIVRADGGVLAGYAHLDISGAQLVAELSVRPECRRQGAGSMLVRALMERAELPTSASGNDTDRLKIWAHGDHPAATVLAQRFGFSRARELWRMVREPAELPAFVEPEGVTFRSFAPGLDEDDVVAVNGRAFAWHPEQGALTVDDLREREAEEWFDPRGLILAHSDQFSRLLGFHWTKIHPDGTGEVYVLGVDPDAQGSGVGKALTLAGLHYLADAGAPRVMLYVEGDNPAAIAVYRRLGFERADIDVQYSR